MNEAPQVKTRRSGKSETNPLAFGALGLGTFTFLSVPLRFKVRGKGRAGNTVLVPARCRRISSLRSRSLLANVGRSRLLAA
jgi:hypothetical protein